MTRQRNGQSFTQMAGDSAQEDSDGQGHNPFMVLTMRLLLFLGQEKNKLYFFLHALIVFYEQACSRTS